MERRIFLAVVLSFIVVYAYQALLIPPVPPASERARGAEDVRAPGDPPPEQTPPVGADRSRRDEQARVDDQARAIDQTRVGETSERDVVIETALVRAVFTNRGGRIREWFLKAYAENAEGRPVNLVPSDPPPGTQLPFSLRVDEGDITPTLNNALYKATVDGTQVIFDYENAAGLRVRKEFRLDPQSYVITFTASVQQGDRALNPFVQWGPGLGDVGSTGGGGSFFTGNYVQPPQAIVHDGEDVTRVTAADVAGQAVHEGTFRFAGVDDHYFMAAAVNPGAERVEYRAVTLPAPGGAEGQRQLLAHTHLFAQPPANVKFYFGPKNFDVLKAVDGELVRAIHYGVFAFLAVPLLGALKWIFGFVGNYGVAIILLTILINLVIFPLRHKSVVSMRRMQELQPQLKAIQDRYADLKVTDPARQKMNTEVMNLYREKGVNPASGCVPMLLTLPVLFAFYSLLQQSIELRGAPFMGWIQDLSQPDPYFITPLLMGGTMFWQQKITPSTADPTQQKIMMMMPLMLSVMFLWAPSGLVLYWFVSNLWAIGQQYFTNWLLGPMPVHAVRPPAERRLKNAGSGRTERAEKRS